MSVQFYYAVPPPGYVKINCLNNVLLHASKSKHMLICINMARQMIGRPAPLNVGNRQITCVHIVIVI